MMRGPTNECTSIRPLPADFPAYPDTPELIAAAAQHMVDQDWTVRQIVCTLYPHASTHAHKIALGEVLRVRQNPHALYNRAAQYRVAHTKRRPLTRFCVGAAQGLSARPDLSEQMFQLERVSLHLPGASDACGRVEGDRMWRVPLPGGMCP